MKFLWRMAALGLLMCSLPACATQEATNNPMHVRVSLHDGSQIVGSSAWHHVQLETPFGALLIPIDSITRIDVHGESDGPVLSTLLTNKDLVSGHIKIESMAITTTFGDQTIPVAQIRRIEVIPANDPFGFANTAWRYRRGDGSTIAPTLVLLKDGYIGGYSHPNETRWAVQDAKLVFLDVNGTPTTIFDKVERQNQPRILGGWMIGKDEYHVLEELNQPRTQSPGPYLPEGRYNLH